MRQIKNLSKKESNKIISAFIIILVILFVVFIFRFTEVMIFKTANGQDLTKLVTQLYNRDEVVAAKRGNIYDVSGEIIATDVKTYSLYAVIKDSYPGVKYVNDKSKLASMLAKHINMDENKILDLLNQSDVYQTSFGNAGTNLNYATKEAIEADLKEMKLEGVYFSEKIARAYPKGYFSNNLIGLAQDTREDTSVSTKSNPINGIMGIEYAYNAQLKGIDGLVNYDKDAYGYSIPGTQKIIEQVKDGNNIYTTLDAKLNDYLEPLMSNVYDKYKPQSMTAMVVRAKTGSIVATSQRPTYNQSKQSYPENGWLNLAVEKSFEPGSTLKVITLAAAVNEGVFSPMALHKSGSIQVFDKTISDWNKTGWGTITQLEGFSVSSNVVMVDLVSKIGYDKWKSYLDAFGFGQSTQSGLPNESAGLNTYNNEVTKANTAFGQGIGVTSYQMMQALTAIAGDGTITKLRYIDRIENVETGEITYTPIETKNSPITPTTAKAVRTYMEEVVYGKRGTGAIYKIDDFKLAAKTGTAEVVDDKTGQYLKGGQNLFSVSAIFPSESPEYIVYITVDRPTVNSSSGHMDEILVPFAKYAMQYIKKADESSEIVEKELPNVTGVNVSLAKQQLETAGFSNVIILGNGTTVISQLPVANSKYLSTANIILNTGGTIKMPNIIGWSKQDVLKLQQLVDITINFNGNGFVTTQSIPENTTINKGMQLTVQLSSKDINTITTKGQTIKESE